MNAKPGHHFDSSYREELRLRDGQPVVFRLIGPRDKQALAEGVARMSPESRFRRFFAYRDHLTTRELAYLTEYDPAHHIAIGVAEADGEQRGLGVARFVRLGAPDSAVAEAAVAIVDDAQGKGLGRLLLDRLIGAAVERGIDTFRFDILAENDAMRGLVERLFPGTAEAIADAEPGVVSLACPLPSRTHPAGEAPAAEAAAAHANDILLYRLLRLAASGTVRVLRGVRLYPQPPPEPHLRLRDAIGLADDDGPAPVPPIPPVPNDQSTS